jgi:outer membrane protein assembly factor BamE (lipoprotein component of BamABCDE complex)
MRLNQTTQVRSSIFLQATTNYPLLHGTLMKHLLFALMMLLLIGCATSHKINSVQLGMTKEEVVAAIGNPVSVSAKDGTEYLNYQFSETDDQAFYGITTPYYVRLVNEIVDSYGRMGDFDSTQNPTIKIESDSKIKTEGDLYTELKKLKELKDEGILTEDEYQAQKQKLLAK